MTPAFLTPKTRLESNLRAVATAGRDRVPVLRALLHDAPLRLQGVPAPRPGAREGTNLIVSLGPPRLVLCAHHDIDPGTEQGALDNSAAVALLATIAQDLTAEGFRGGVEIVFTDLEEPGNGGFACGAREYARSLAWQPPSMAIALDVFGAGPRLVCSRRDPIIPMHVRLEHLLGERIPMVPTPGGDDVGFTAAGVPCMLLTSLPDDLSTGAWRLLHGPGDDLSAVDVPSLAKHLAFLHRLATHPEWGAWSEPKAPRLPLPVGWECPRCGTVHAPLVDRCGCPPPYEVVVSDSSAGPVASSGHADPGRPPIGYPPGHYRMD